MFFQLDRLLLRFWVLSCWDCHSFLCLLLNSRLVMVQGRYVLYWLTSLLLGPCILKFRSLASLIFGLLNEKASVYPMQFIDWKWAFLWSSFWCLCGRSILKMSTWWWRCHWLRRTYSHNICAGSTLFSDSGPFCAKLCKALLPPDPGFDKYFCVFGISHRHGYLLILFAQIFDLRATFPCKLSWRNFCFAWVPITCKAIWMTIIKACHEGLVEITFLTHISASNFFHHQILTFLQKSCVWWFRNYGTIILHAYKFFDRGTGASSVSSRLWISLHILCLSNWEHLGPSVVLRPQLRGDCG